MVEDSTGDGRREQGRDATEEEDEKVMDGHCFLNFDEEMF